jgi:hypothetical protein
MTEISQTDAPKPRLVGINHIALVEIVEYGDIQFTKAPHVLRAMGFDLDKTEKARRELSDKGMAP